MAAGGSAASPRENGEAMKKPNFYVKFAVYQVVILIVLIGAVIHTSQICAQPSPLPDWSEAAPAVWKQREIVPMLSVGLFIEHFSIALIAFGFCWEKESRWLWANQQKLITSIHLKRVEELKQPGLEVFFLPKKKRKAAMFRVACSGYRFARSLRMPLLDPQFQAVMNRVDSPAVLRDRHIVKTRIIAAGHRFCTVTQRNSRAVRSSFNGVVHSWGTSRSISEPGSSLFTFLVFFDDRKTVTEKAWEGTPRCAFLLDKLEK